MKSLLLVFLVFANIANAQKLKKSEKVILQNLKDEVTYLSDDKLEGRLTGSAGEKLAYQYLENKFGEIGLKPLGDSGTFLQSFTIDEGKEILPASHFMINNEELRVSTDFFPFLFGADGSVQAFAVPAFKEQGSPWFLDVKDIVDRIGTNPHLDYENEIRSRAASFAGKGANAVIVYNSNFGADDLVFHPFSDLEQLNIPVVFLTKAASKKYLDDLSANLDLDLKIATGDKVKVGHNVVGYLDNGAAYTIVAGAHYDHLGYGEEHNSLWTGTPAIHNGADDNASGTALVTELARMLTNSKLKKYNYLFACFSGEELGLIGSKYFVNHLPIAIDKINFMLNADMVGRLSEPGHALTIGGYGTSPSWPELLKTKSKYFQVKYDSSGIGPSDHTSFYLKDIPVLFFFTGSHKDYHKPSDDADKVNYTGELQVLKYAYDIIEKANESGKLAFTKTKETGADIPRFTVSLGIMPDYTYNKGNGVRADAVIDGKPAQKAGILAGDVITAIDDNPTNDLMGYMKVLSKYKKGDRVKVAVLRNDSPLSFDLTF